jgi:serine/threonine protein kinase
LSGGSSNSSNSSEAPVLFTATYTIGIRLTQDQELALLSTGTASEDGDGGYRGVNAGVAPVLFQKMKEVRLLPAYTSSSSVHMRLGGTNAYYDDPLTTADYLDGESELDTGTGKQEEEHGAMMVVLSNPVWLAGGSFVLLVIAMVCFRCLQYQNMRGTSYGDDPTYDDGGDAWRLKMAKTNASTSTLAADLQQLNVEAWHIWVIDYAKLKVGTSVAEGSTAVIREVQYQGQGRMVTKQFTFPFPRCDLPTTTTPAAANSAGASGGVGGSSGATSASWWWATESSSSSAALEAVASDGTGSIGANKMEKWLLTSSVVDFVFRSTTLPVPSNFSEAEEDRKSSSKKQLKGMFGTQATRKVRGKTVEEAAGAAAEAKRGFSRVCDEAMILSSLRHPNIVNFFGVALAPTASDGSGSATAAGILCSIGNNSRSLHEMHLVMEAGKTTVGKMLQKMSTMVAVTVGLQVAQALLFLHKKRLVHRDVKPDNILIMEWRTSSNRYKHLVLAKLCDFGSAMLTSDDIDMDVFPAAETSTVSAGTVEYMAPEILMGSSFDALAGSTTLSASEGGVAFGEVTIKRGTKAKKRGGKNGRGIGGHRQKTGGSTAGSGDDASEPSGSAIFGIQARLQAGDVYALGVTLWSMVNHKRPYLAVPTARLLMAVTNEGLRPDSESKSPRGSPKTAFFQPKKPKSPRDGSKPKSPRDGSPSPLTLSSSHLTSADSKSQSPRSSPLSWSRSGSPKSWAKLAAAGSSETPAAVEPMLLVTKSSRYFSGETDTLHMTASSQAMAPVRVEVPHAANFADGGQVPHANTGVVPNTVPLALQKLWSEAWCCDPSERPSMEDITSRLVRFCKEVDGGNKKKYATAFEGGADPLLVAPMSLGSGFGSMRRSKLMHSMANMRHTASHFTIANPLRKSVKGSRKTNKTDIKNQDGGRGTHALSKITFDQEGGWSDDDSEGSDDEALDVSVVQVVAPESPHLKPNKTNSSLAVTEQFSMQNPLCRSAAAAREACAL